MMKLLSQKSLRLSLAALATLLMLTQFNNCSGYQTPTNSERSSLDVVCDADCITPTLDNLEIKVNLGGGTEYSVPADLAEWNMGGDCNEGGYPYNTIIWELYLNGVKVRDSSMTGMAGANNVNSRCVNGRFLLYLNMAAIAADNVNRTGLRTGAGTTRASYDLYVEIFGQTTLNGTAQRNSLKGRKRISLLPITL